MQRVVTEGNYELVQDGLATIYMFEVFYEREASLFSGGFQKYHMVVELVDQWNLWQVTIIQHDGFLANRTPEEVFLFENVEQILTGIDKKMGPGIQPKVGLLSRSQRVTTFTQAGQGGHTDKHYALFCLKTATGSCKQHHGSIYVVLPTQEESDRFARMVERIKTAKGAARWANKQFLSLSLSAMAAPPFIKMKSRFYELLQGPKERLVQSVQAHMRQTHTRPSMVDG